MNDNIIKRRDAPYTTVAAKDGKSVTFFFRSTTCLFLEVHLVNCPAAQMFFSNENFWKNIEGYSHRPTWKNRYFSEFFHLMLCQIKNTVYVYTVSVNSRNKCLKYSQTFETTFWIFRTSILHEFQINGVRIAVYWLTLAC